MLGRIRLRLLELPILHCLPSPSLSRSLPFSASFSLFLSDALSVSLISLSIALTSLFRSLHRPLLSLPFPLQPRSVRHSYRYCHRLPNSKKLINVRWIYCRTCCNQGKRLLKLCNVAYFIRFPIKLLEIRTNQIVSQGKYKSINSIKWLSSQFNSLFFPHSFVVLHQSWSRFSISFVTIRCHSSSALSVFNKSISFITPYFAHFFFHFFPTSV